MFYYNNTQDISNEFFVLGDLKGKNYINTVNDLTSYISSVFKQLKSGLQTNPDYSYEIVGRLGSYLGNGYDIFISSQFMK